MRNEDRIFNAKTSNFYQLRYCIISHSLSLLKALLLFFSITSVWVHISIINQLTIISNDILISITNLKTSKNWFKTQIFRFSSQANLSLMRQCIWQPLWGNNYDIIRLFMNLFTGRLLHKGQPSKFSRPVFWTLQIRFQNNANFMTLDVITFYSANVWWANLGNCKYEKLSYVEN